MRLVVIRHTSRIWRYRWDLRDDNMFHTYNFAITTWGARWAAHKALMKHLRPKPKNAGKVVFEKEF